jgi:hypothetical protein
MTRSSSVTTGVRPLTPVKSETTGTRSLSPVSSTVSRPPITVAGTLPVAKALPRRAAIASLAATSKDVPSSIANAGLSTATSKKSYGLAEFKPSTVSAPTRLAMDSQNTAEQMLLNNGVTIEKKVLVNTDGGLRAKYGIGYNSRGKKIMVNLDHQAEIISTDADLRTVRTTRATSVPVSTIVGINECLSLGEGNRVCSVGFQCSGEICVSLNSQESGQPENLVLNVVSKPVAETALVGDSATPIPVVSMSDILSNSNKVEEIVDVAYERIAEFYRRRMTSTLRQVLELPSRLNQAVINFAKSVNVATRDLSESNAFLDGAISEMIRRDEIGDLSTQEQDNLLTLLFNRRRRGDMQEDLYRIVRQADEANALLVPQIERFNEMTRFINTTFADVGDGVYRE